MRSGDPIERPHTVVIGPPPNQEACSHLLPFNNVQDDSYVCGMLYLFHIVHTLAIGPVRSHAIQHHAYTGEYLQPHAAVFDATTAKRYLASSILTV